MAKKDTQKPIEHYIHTDKKRVNNPQIGLVTPKTDPEKDQKKTYAYEPHLDPQLQWAGKAGHTSFKVPTVSLHVHERIDAKNISKKLRITAGNVNKRDVKGGKDEDLCAEPEVLKAFRDTWELGIGHPFVFDLLKGSFAVGARVVGGQRQYFCADFR
ncbi:MAG: hypothetical protein ABL903_10300 [Methylococcales bacterium]